MSDISKILRSFLVYLDDVTDYEMVLAHKWFLASNPPSMTCRPIRDVSDEEVISSHRERLKNDSLRDFAVKRVSDNCLVGRVSYFDMNPRNRTVETGFIMGPEFRKQGYAYQAMRLLMGHLFGQMGMNKIVAQTGEFNEASISLLKKLGFSQDGRLRQHHELDGEMHDDLLFSILAEEFGS